MSSEFGSAALERVLRGVRRWGARGRLVYDFLLNHADHRRGRAGPFRPAYAIYELTYACNLDCSYCDDGAGNSYPRQVGRARPLSLPAALELLRRLRRHVPSIYLCGGEPTVHRHFLELLREVDRLGFCPVIVNTNGLRLPELHARDPALFRRIDVLVLSLDATDADALDGLFRGRRGDGRRALAALEHALAWAPRASCTIAVNCVITPDTVGHAREVAALCRHRGISFNPVPANRGAGLLGDLSGTPGYAALIEEILRPHGPPGLGPRAVYETLLRFRPFECHPSLRLHITPDGRVPWPCQSDRRHAPAILDYPSIPELLRAADVRFASRGHGRRCAGPCYLAQNASTELYLERPWTVLAEVVPALVLRGRDRSRGVQAGRAEVAIGRSSASAGMPTSGRRSLPVVGPRYGTVDTKPYSS